MNKTWKKCIRVILFLATFGVVLSIASAIMIPKDNTPESGIVYYKARGFLSEPVNSIDILAIGDSNVQQAVSPMLLWKQGGYTAYTCGEPLQKTWDAYYLLQDFLACQKPKLVIYETDGIFSPRDDTEADAINEAAEAFMGRMFPVVTYHNRWKTLTKEDFIKKPYYTWHSVTKGFRVDKEVEGEEKSVSHMKRNKEKEPMRMAVKLYLDKFVALCRKEGIPILFVSAPSLDGWDTPAHNTMVSYTQAEDITYLDLNILTNEIGIDWETDTSDGGTHLNISGSHKVTQYLYTYLEEHYQIPSHTDEKGYEIWDLDYEEYQELIHQ